MCNRVSSLQIENAVRSRTRRSCHGSWQILLTTVRPSQGLTAQEHCC
jgi:hypothetical protein